MPLPEFPPFPIPPAEFLDDYLKVALSELAASDASDGLEAEIGLALHGEGGGEWVLALSRGRLALHSASRMDTPATLVQSVEDWRGGLWEGRGAGIGKAVARLFRADAQRIGNDFDRAAPAVLGALRKLDGLLRVEVIDADRGAWNLDLRLGPGALPPKPTTVLSVSGADADRLLDGELNPLEAFMAGRIQLRGEIGLLLQLQSAGKAIGRALRR